MYAGMVAEEVAVNCSHCGGQLSREYRYCPWCATAQTVKAVAHFPPHPDVDAPGRGLRVSRYFDPEIGPPHTRLSVYDEEGRITSVVALDDRQTARLATFLGELCDDAPTERIADPLKRLVERLDPRA